MFNVQILIKFTQIALISKNIIIFMNPQFQSNRSPHQPQPFYNPQKDFPNPNNPTLYHTPPAVTGPFLPGASSKSYIARSNILEGGKPNINTSVNLKNLNDSASQSNRFMPGNATSPTNMYPNGNYNGFPGNFTQKNGQQMVKSTIKDGINTNELNFGYPSKPLQKGAFNQMGGTPNRRAPRMSEPHQFGTDPPSNSFQFKPQTQGTNDSPGLQKKFKDQRDPENQFFRNRQLNLKAVEEKEVDEKSIKTEASTKSDIWNKKTVGRKRGFTINDFKKIKQLGSGKYGQVSLVQERNSGFTCALKMIEKKFLKEEDIVQQFTRQLKIQQYLNHPNIIKLYGFFDDENYIYIILEVGTGGQLQHQFKKSEPVAQAKVAPIMKQVCDAVNEIHSLRIIHRDIKPQNIVIHDNVIKLCDFGWSVYLDNSLRTTFCGTPLYVCPEILKGKEYDQKIDIWSLGIMLYQMLVGENPFKITREQQLIKIVKDEIAIPSYVFVSKQARDFLDKCLKKNPADRVGIRQLLNHDFLIKNQEKGEKKMAF